MTDHPERALEVFRVMLSVKVYPHRPGIAMGNILWPGKFPARYNLFPPDHPCAPRSQVFNDDNPGQYGNGGALAAFRARGYWASCFPEGDGITWKQLKDQSDAQCLEDIRECFTSWNAQWAGPKRGRGAIP